MDHNKYVETFIGKLNELAKTKPELVEVAVRGNIIKKETQFMNFDRVWSLVGQTKALQAIGNVFNFDPTAVIHDPSTTELGIQQFINEMLDKIYIKKFMEILLVRAINLYISNANASQGGQSLSDVFDTTFNDGTRNGINEVLFFDLLRVYIFNGHHNATDLGLANEFSVMGVEDAMNHKGKRSISQVVYHATYTLKEKPLFDQIPLAVMSLCALTLGSTPANGMVVHSKEGNENNSSTKTDPAVDAVAKNAKDITKNTIDNVTNKITNHVNEHGGIRSKIALKLFKDKLKGKALDIANKNIDHIAVKVNDLEKTKGGGKKPSSRYLLAKKERRLRTSLGQIKKTRKLRRKKRRKTLRKMQHPRRS
jgi:hypothetical protein